jgi:transposase
MDNATFHKREDIIKQFVDNNHTVEFLPAYSPDLNPIENKWAQAKAIRKNKSVHLLNFFYILLYDFLN